MPDTAAGATAALPNSNAKLDPPVTTRGNGSGNGSIVVDSRKLVAVPSFTGAALRSVIEQADQLGLRVQPVGSGVAREQVPAAGTMVPAGTQIAVRFSR
jgi:cell division protein FtsI (penicillin-binding protein 3)